MDIHALRVRLAVVAVCAPMVAAGALLATPRCASAARGETAQPAVNRDAQTMAEFEKRVHEYVELHRKLESSLPSLPKEATPRQIDARERALARLVQEARKDARPGELFTPPMRALVRELLRRAMKEPGGRGLKQSILDEYTGSVTLRVNGRYPDAVPLSTVPPQVLQNLPPLPEDLEYRFVGDRLILLDPHAHIIIDYIDKVFP